MKLVTWNTQSCKGLDGKASPERIVEHARTLADFDVLCLQEVADHYTGLTGAFDADQPAAIAALLPGFHLFFGPSVDEFAPASATSSRRGCPSRRCSTIRCPFPPMRARRACRACARS